MARPLLASLALLTTVVGAPRARSQGWRWLSPRPQGVAINAAAFRGTQGWYVGAAGTIGTTADGAQTFVPQVSGVSVDLYGVFFLDATHGWAVGDLGTILATQDGGDTWAPEPSPSSRKLRGVYFTDALHGLVVGDYRTLLQTADGGHTWTGRAATPLSLNAVTFTDSLHGFICGEGGAIVMTADGGNTFTTVQTPSSAHLLAIAFADSLHGFAVGQGGAVVTTSDGGASWTAQTLGADDLVGLVVLSATQAFALGSAGLLYATSDGNAWTPLERVAGSGLFDTLVAEPSGALDVAEQTGTWLRAAPADGGTPLVPSFGDVNDLIPANTSAVGVAFGSIDAGVLVANGFLYATQDRALHLTRISIPDAGPSVSFLAVSMPTATDAFAVGGRGTAAVSHDMGLTWTLQPTGVTADLAAVQFLDAQHGFAVGSGGTIIATTDGVHWTRLQTSVSDNWTSLAFRDAQTGIVGSQLGTVVYTLDGHTFEPATASLLGAIQAAAYPAKGVALIGGAYDGLAHSLSAGLTFYNLTSPSSTANFSAMAFGSHQNGYLGGQQPTGDIWFTSDGAQSFALQFSSALSINAFSFIDATHGYAVGQGGMLLYTDSAGGAGCASDAQCADAGYAGMTCLSGACQPCTTDDRCGATCAACPAATPYCYGGYCGACLSDLDCTSPGYCALGSCQQPAASDGGGGSGTGGASSSTSSSSGGTTGSLRQPDGGLACNTANNFCSPTGSGCGCSQGAGGFGLWVLIVSALSLPRRRQRR